VLGTQRSPQFKTAEGQRQALQRLTRAGVEGLVVIGGEGSISGALRLKELGVAVVGIPATIDNDVWGTEIAIGVDTALNTALEAIRPHQGYRELSHHRAHVVEAMGRNCGYLVLMSTFTNQRGFLEHPQEAYPCKGSGAATKAFSETDGTKRAEV
jgi:6-phosphofructokinase 1